LSKSSRPACPYHRYGRSGKLMDGKAHGSILLRE
jgi:hypothetical protein